MFKNKNNYNNNKTTGATTSNGTATGFVILSCYICGKSRHGTLTCTTDTTYLKYNISSCFSFN